MSNVKQCRQCGRLFQSFSTNLCPECADEMERCFRIVKDYVYDHPEANVFDISKKTGVPEKMVLNFLREGRFSINSAELECEQCGEPISSGRYCSVCQARLENVLSNAYKPPAHDPKKEKQEESGRPSYGRMHVNYREK